MSTAIEDRLTAALHARAELVQPEDLRHQVPRDTRAQVRWRRPAVVALVAAAAVAAIAIPVALRGDNTTDQPATFDHQWPPRPHFPVPQQPITDHLSGDVDGDGRADQIRVSGHTLTVTLAADPGHPLTTSSSDTAGLVGFIDVGGPGRAILVKTDDLAAGAEWQTIALKRGQLKLVLLHGHAESGSVQVVPGYQTAWLTPGGGVMTGLLDPVQQGERRLAVEASRVDVRNGRPVITSVGRWCWDVVTQKVPAPCPAGVDDAFDPGPHGALPAIRPPVNLNDSIGPGETWKQGSTSLRLVEDPTTPKSEFKQLYDVVGTIDGHDVSARAGVFGPDLYKRFIDLGHGVRGLAVDDESSPESTWNLLAFVGGRLVPLSVPGGQYALHPGVQAVPYHGSGEEPETWIGPNGQVFTTLQTGGPGRDELFEWQVTDSSGSKLTAVDLGRLCSDDFWGTYGTC